MKIIYIKIILELQKPMKSMSLINSDAIQKSPANNSPSKYSFAFSKTKRFPDPNP